MLNVKLSCLQCMETINTIDTSTLTEEQQLDEMAQIEMVVVEEARADDVTLRAYACPRCGVKIQVQTKER